MWLNIRNVFVSNKKPLHPINESKAQIKAEAKKHALRLLKRIGLEDKAHVYPSTCPGIRNSRSRLFVLWR